MKGIISSFRRSKHRTSENQMIVKVNGIEDKESAEKLVGKTLVWKTDGQKDKKITGKISAVHGSKGFVRAIFEKGMPGQALREEVDISEK
jgi:large subunit ribosomal protein L35Ae